MKNIPYFDGKYTQTLFDKDAQGAFETKWTIVQDNAKIKIEHSLYDPYTRKTSYSTIEGEIVAFSKKLKIVKIKSDDDKLYWFDYDKIKFVNPEPEQIFYLKNKKASFNVETLNTLAKFFSTAISIINGKKINFIFDKITNPVYSSETDSYKILTEYFEISGLVRMQLMTPDEVLAFIELGIYKDKKRNGHITFVGVNQNTINIIFDKYRKIIDDIKIVSEW